MELAARRANFRKGLSNLYLPFYDALCAELPAEWQPYFGLRTIEEQNGLYAKGRSTPGEPCADPKPCAKHPLGLVVTNAKGGESAHNYGCASDWTLWTPDGKPVWMPASDPRWQVYLAAIAKVGLRSGSTFPSPDFPHNELKISCSYKHIAIFYAQGGMTSAQDHIKENM
jgi:hypothetical protein